MLKMKPMASLIVTVCGIVLAIAAFIYVLTYYRPFLSPEGFLIVVGGSVANAFLSYQREDVLKAFSTMFSMLKKPAPARERLHKDIEQIIKWSYVVQSDDLLGLERETANVNEPLLRYGLDLVVSGYSANKIRQMMQTVAEAEFERRTAPVTVLRNMAAAAPAFGMVGTLIGMVSILHSVSGNVAGVGEGLGIAMLATLYGILVARLFCLPAADKLLQKEEREQYRNFMITEGLILLANKQKPFYVQDRLNSYLDPSMQLEFNHYMYRASARPFAMAA